MINCSFFNKKNLKNFEAMLYHWNEMCLSWGMFTLTISACVFRIVIYSWRTYLIYIFTVSKALSSSKNANQYGKSMRKQNVATRLKKQTLYSFSPCFQLDEMFLLFPSNDRERFLCSNTRDSIWHQIWTHSRTKG